MLTVQVTKDPALVRRAQELRYKVFAGERGASLASAPWGIDEDRFDAHCEHLVVRHAERVVGTYRILPPAAANAAGGYSLEQLFDIAPLDAPSPVTSSRTATTS